MRRVQINVLLILYMNLSPIIINIVRTIADYLDVILFKQESCLNYGFSDRCGEKFSPSTNQM